MQFKPFTIGKYHFVELLGRGGMAEVYRVKSGGVAGFEKELAIKRILPSFGADASFVQKFEDEARLMCILTHPNIVQVFEFLKAGRTNLLVMEYVKGDNLSELLKSVTANAEQIPIEFSIYVINEVLKGLDYAHKKKDPKTGQPLNIIHRDISPHNIMLSIEGSVKLVDFGIAKARSQSNRTETGMIKGKLAYMSPEQGLGKPLDHRSDIYSVALTLVELITGQRIFEAETDLACLRMVQEGIIPDLTTLNPNITPELNTILLKALERDKEKRYESCAAFHHDLQAYLSAHWPDFGEEKAAQFIQGYIKLDERAAKNQDVESLSTSEEELLGQFEDTSPYSLSQETRIRTSAGAPPPLPQRQSKNTFQNLLLVALVIGMGTIAYVVFSPKQEEAAKQDTAPSGLCALSITSDPPGAKIELNSREVGATPLELSRPCGASLSLVLKKKGFKAASQTVELKKALTEISPKLQKTAQGTLLLTANHRAKVYVDDVFHSMAEASQPTRLTLDSERKYRIRLNEENGPGNITREYELKESQTLDDAFTFAALPPPKPVLSQKPTLSRERAPAASTPIPAPSPATPQAQPQRTVAAVPRQVPAPSAGGGSDEYDKLSKEAAAPSSGSSLVDGFYQRGLTAFNQGNFDDAFKNFRATRKIRTAHLQSWIYEIRSLSSLNRADEAQKVAQELVKLRPDLKFLPVLKPYLPK